MTVKSDSSSAALEAKKETVFKPFNYGLNTYTLTVTAPDGTTTKTYTIKATRQKGSLVLKTFKGTDLSDFYSASFKDYQKTGQFGSKLFKVNVASSVTKTTITAEAEFPDTTTIKIKAGDSAEETFSGSKEVELKKDVTQVTLTLTSTTLSQTWGNVYTLNITKGTASGSSEASLEKLEASYYGGATFYGIRFNETWSPDTLNYTLKLPSNIYEIKLEAKTKDPKAVIEGWGGTTNLISGPFDNKKVEIPVVAEDGTRKTYSITVSQFDPAALKIDTPPENTVINVSQLPSGGYEVKGTFSNAENKIKEIWVGSSGLPIQESLGKKWVKATLNGGNKFTATLTHLGELANGTRDIKAVAFNANDAAVAVARVPVTVTGSTVAVGSVNVEIKPNGYQLPRDGSLTVYAYDKEYWNRREDVVLGGYSLKSLAGITFPTTLQIQNVTTSHECRIIVEVRDGANSLVYYGSTDLSVSPNTTNSCSVDIRKAQ